MFTLSILVLSDETTTLKDEMAQRHSSIRLRPHEQGEAACRKALGEVALVRITDRDIREAAHGAEDASTVDSVADREGAAALERIGQPRDVPDVLDEFSFVAGPVPLREVRPLAVGVLFSWASCRPL